MGKNDSKTTSVQQLSPQQQQLLGLVMPAAQSYMNKPLQLYPKNVTPGFTPAQVVAQKKTIAAGKNAGSLASIGKSSAKSLIDVSKKTSSAGAKTAGQSVGQLQGFGGYATGQGLGGALSQIKGLGQGTGLANYGLSSVLGDYASGAKTRDLFTSGKLMDPKSNPALQASITAALRPIKNDLTRNILPGIDSQFAGGNSFGSSRQGIAQGMALQGAQQAGADATAGIVNNAYNQGLGATLQALNAQTQAATQGIGQGYNAGASAGGLGGTLAGLGMQGLSSAGNIGTNMFNFGNQGALGGMSQLPTFAQMAYAPAQAYGAVGQQQYQQKGAQSQEAQQKFTTQQMLPFLQAQDVANLAFGMGGGSSVTTAQQPTNWGGMLMGGGSLLAALPGLFALSDRRLKKDIVFIGKDWKGIKWYHYTINGHRDVGVMADEVPEAVVGNLGGYSVVDYSRV